MAEPAINISLLGDKELERKFRKLEPRIQKKYVLQAFRKSAKRLKAHIMDNVLGAVVSPDTGRYAAALLLAKPKTPADFKGKKGVTGIGIDLPRRNVLGIGPKEKWYYPSVLEYGSTIDPGRYPAFAPVRKAVNAHARQELERIRVDIGKGIEREAAK